jgi:phosphonopyruvate decarboxylase
VYLQNSGEGNLINPAASLLNDQVYAIPVVFIVGWRGEPGVPDEPQHRYQGTITLQLLEDLDIRPYILDKATDKAAVRGAMSHFQTRLAEGKSVAFVVRKGALSYDGKTEYKNTNPMRREEIIQHIVQISGDAPIVSTTGKASRELFETRAANGEGHQRDFLTVGSMGHASSIALGVALQKPNAKIWCIDGDGAALMHLGAMAVIGAQKPRNLIHIVVNNGAHESVGGLPTVAGEIDLSAIAKACGYPYASSAATWEQLDAALAEAKARNALTFLEVKCAIGARSDLGRPTTSALENKQAFMDYLKTL